MSAWEHRTVTTTRVEYVLASPAHWEEVHRMLNAIRVIVTAKNLNPEPTVQVRAEDGEIVAFYELDGTT